MNYGKENVHRLNCGPNSVSPVVALEERRFGVTAVRVCQLCEGSELPATLEQASPIGGHLAGLSAFTALS